MKCLIFAHASSPLTILSMKISTAVISGRLKIISSCLMFSKINLKELKFLLDQQRTKQLIMIGGVDVVGSRENL